MLNFKTEIALLLSAIVLYVVSAFCYSYETPTQEMVAQTLNDPYRIYTYPLAVLASVLLVVAAFLYSKRRQLKSRTGHVS